MLIATAIICIMTVTAFASDLFSSLSGDALSLDAKYIGNGIVEIQVENRSDKPLKFQSQFMLKLWSTGEDIKRLSENYEISGTDFPPHSSGTMRIDLSDAYDIETLELPLTDDHYYFCLTNNNFLFGQDWICSVNFSEPVITKEYTIYNSWADENLLPLVEQELRFYFESFPAWPSEEARALYDEYVAAYTALFERMNINPIRPYKPLRGNTLVGGSGDSVPSAGFTLSGESEQISIEHAIFDFDKKLLAGDMEQAIVINGLLPSGQNPGSYNYIPMLYLFVYEKSQCTSESLLFIHGQLISYEQAETHKVYEDSEFICLDLSEYIYSDYEEYFKKLHNNSSYIPNDFQQINSLRLQTRQQLGEILTRHENIK